MRRFLLYIYVYNTLYDYMLYSRLAVPCYDEEAHAYGVAYSTYDMAHVI